MSPLDPRHLSSRMHSTVQAMLPQINNKFSTRDSPKDPIPPKIDLATAENWLLRPELEILCKQAIAQDMTAESFSYPRGLGGDPSLLAALAEVVNRYFRPAIPIRPEQIVATAGASACLDGVFYSLCEEGDSVLVPAPYWNGFDFHLSLHSPTINLIPVHQSLGTPAGALLPALKRAYDTAPEPARVKAMLFTNPTNPLGQCYPAAVIRECMLFCAQRGLHFVSDEVYALSVHGGGGAEEAGGGCGGEGEEENDGWGQGFGSALALLEGPNEVGAGEGEVTEEPDGEGSEERIDASRVHVIWSISKDLGPSGFRMASLISPSNQPLLTSLAFLNTTQLSSLSSLCTTHLLTSPRLPHLLNLMRQRLATSYALVTSMLKRRRISYVHARAGLFVFARLAKGTRKVGEEMEEDLLVKRLEERGALVAAGRGFHVGEGEGERGWVRICFAIGEDELREGLRRIEEVLDAE